MQISHKNDYTQVKLYKPIALLDIIGKVFESILAKKISILTKIDHLLLKTHFGEGRNALTEHAI